MVDQFLFNQYVRDVFRRLDDRPYLAAHPLRALLAPGNSKASPDDFRRTLMDAVEQLRPPDRTPASSLKWRHWQCLTLRYVDGATTKQIARQLRISDRQVLRDEIAGIEAVALSLWEAYRERSGFAPPTESRRSIAAASRASGTTATAGEDIESEIARASASPPFTVTNVVEVLDGALATMQSLAESRRARIEVSVPDDLRPTWGSPIVLRQMLLCLLTFAVQSQPAPRVEIVATSDGTTVRLRLAIRGRARRGSGATVLPESVVSLIEEAGQLVDIQGGELCNQVLVDGSRLLTLTLPATPVSMVLVIDDNPDVVELFRSYLAGGAYHFLQARTPLTAIELAQTLHPAAITLDVMMPSQDGWQILQQLRNDPATCDIPIIVCSILNEQALAQSFGITDFLAKPVTPQRLRAALERSLKTSGSEEHRGFRVSRPSPHPPTVHRPG